MAGGINEYVSEGDQQNDRTEMLKAFDETMAGVKGLVDSGFMKVPEIFVRPSEELSEELTTKKTRVQVPVIDLSGILDQDRRKQVVEEVRSASEIWGFFQVVNHGIPLTVLDAMIDGIRQFHELDIEEKKKYYSRDLKTVTYISNYDLYFSKTANWRDTLIVSFWDQLNSNQLPACCRNSTLEYSKHVENLGINLFELLSEALGLERDHLYNMECSTGHQFTCHYYPACPEPELTMGTTNHTDPGFVTILLQNQISGLQVLHQGQWVDIEPTPGGLVINIGDLLQLVTNGKFRSNIHRAKANSFGPRISVPCFIAGPVSKVAKVYEPIKELISEEHPAIYRDVLLGEYVLKFFNTGLDKKAVLDYYKI